jgi:hypothetical protein
MASKHQMTGMLGVYLVAAELTKLGLIVSVTSRNAKGADLIAVSPSYKKAWSIQVKTNSRPSKYWLLSKDFKKSVAKQLIYVFVNIRTNDQADYYVAPSTHVARYGKVFPRPNSTFYGYDRVKANQFHNNWSLFR